MWAAATRGFEDIERGDGGRVNRVKSGVLVSDSELEKVVLQASAVRAACPFGLVIGTGFVEPAGWQELWRGLLDSPPASAGEVLEQVRRSWQLKQQPRPTPQQQPQRLQRRQRDRKPRQLQRRRPVQPEKLPLRPRRQHWNPWRLQRPQRCGSTSTAFRRQRTCKPFSPVTVVYGCRRRRC